MGIPKFYRWLSERYPLVNQPVGVAAIPEFDALYLDMNGIIHNCTHGNDPSRKLTEAEMILRVFNYLDKLIQIVKPQKLLFMAIDGVAPRAKMNQQRSRRFRSARDAQEARDAAARRGEQVPNADEAFDSNCITPGTAFMGRLGEHLRFFIRRKMADDPVWQRPRIVFSGHDVPGEGEHKIMEYIRWDMRRPEYEPNQRHCLYGLDADLIMLSLVTHEPHFCLLREVVSYSGGNRGQPPREVMDNPCAEHFILFQVGLLRDYLELEFQNPDLGFPFDRERIIDDFVLFCMLVGNDFLPSLPTLDIAEGALDKIFAEYKKLLPVMGGYLTEAGTLNRGRLQLLLDRIAGLELATLELRAQDAEYFESKKSRGRGGNGRNGPAYEPPAARVSEVDEGTVTDADIQMMGGAAADLQLLAALEGLPVEKEPEGPTMMGREARQLMLSGQGAAGLQMFKEKYYAEKLGISRQDAPSRRAVVQAYIEGLHWVLEYYYRGVASWTWYYPYHYAPMVSDMTDVASLDVGFTRGKPFLPFEQLLGVLPAASCRLLPAPLQRVMTDPNSPVIDFYPADFRVDQEGKRNDWEGIVLIPFVDEARLLAASNSVNSERLSDEERQRNKLGDMLLFERKEGSTETYFCQSTLPASFASVERPNSRCLRQPPPPPLPAGAPGFQPKLTPGTVVGPGQPAGFATIKTLGLTSEVRNAGVAVFGRPSSKESLILKVKPLRDVTQGQEITSSMVANTLIGERCWVKWPYLQEAVVAAVSDRSQRISAGAADGGMQTVKHSSSDVDDWAFRCTKLSNEFLTQQGMEVGPTDVMVHVRLCEGLVRQLDGTVEKRFSKTETPVPLQVTLRRNPAPDPRLDAVLSAGAAADVEPGSCAIFVGRAYYGCAVTVLPSASQGFDHKGRKVPGKASSMVRVELQPAPASAGQAATTARRLLTTISVQYQPSGMMARRLSIDPRTLGKITGNVVVAVGDTKVDVGLVVKSGKGPLCVPDYTKPADSGTGWQYSQALASVLSQYKARFPWVLRMLEQHPEEREWDASLAFPDSPPDVQIRSVREVRDWLKKLPLGRRPLVKTTAKVAPEEAVRQLQTMMPAAPRNPPELLLLENVAPGLLLPPAGRGLVAAALAGGTFDLGDRVACLRGSGSPPLAARGTVVGIYDDDGIEVLFDVEFPEGTDLHGRCTGRAGAMLPATELLNLSKPHAVAATGANAPKVVRKQKGTMPIQRAASQPSKVQNGTHGEPLVVPNGSVAGGPIPAATDAPSGTVKRPASAGPFVNPERPGSRPSSRPASPARVRGGPPVPPQPKGPKGPPDAHDPGSRGFAMGRGRPLPPPSAPLSTVGVAPGMALLQSLRQVPAVPTTGVPTPPDVLPLPIAPPSGAAAAGGGSAAVPLTTHLAASNDNKTPPPPAPAAGSTSGAALLQQLQRATISAAPAPHEAASAAERTSVTSTTSDVQVPPGLAAFNELQRAPPPEFAEAAAAAAHPDVAAASAALELASSAGDSLSQARRTVSGVSSSSGLPPRPEVAAGVDLASAASSQPTASSAVSAAAGMDLLRQLRGSSFEAEASDLASLSSSAAPAGTSTSAAITPPPLPPILPSLALGTSAAPLPSSHVTATSLPSASLPDGLALLRSLQRSREEPTASVAASAAGVVASAATAAAAAMPQQLPLPMTLPAAIAAPRAAACDVQRSAPELPPAAAQPAAAVLPNTLGAAFLQQLQRPGSAGAPAAAAATAAPQPPGSPAQHRQLRPASASQTDQGVQQQAAGGNLLQLLQRGGSGGALPAPHFPVRPYAPQGLQPQQPQPPPHHMGYPPRPAHQGPPRPYFPPQMFPHPGMPFPWQHGGPPPPPGWSQPPAMYGPPLPPPVQQGGPYGFPPLALQPGSGFPAMPQQARPPPPPQQQQQRLPPVNVALRQQAAGAQGPPSPPVPVPTPPSRAPRPRTRPSATGEGGAAAPGGSPQGAPLPPPAQGQLLPPQPSTPVRHGEPASTALASSPGHDRSSSGALLLSLLTQPGSAAASGAQQVTADGQAQSVAAAVAPAGPVAADGGAVTGAVSAPGQAAAGRSDASATSSAAGGGGGANPLHSAGHNLLQQLRRPASRQPPTVGAGPPAASAQPQQTAEEFWAQLQNSGS